MDIYTPDERLLRTIQRQMQRARYWLAAVQDPRRRLAARVEADVADRLRAAGYFVTRTRHNDPFDLLVNGVRIEVKAATWSSGRYQAALRDNDADALVFGCLNGRLHYFIIPFVEVRGLTHLKISSHDPERYAGRWTRWLEAWPIIDEMIARGINHWQMPLWRTI